jgi:hypothetical protein
MQRFSRARPRLALMLAMVVSTTALALPSSFGRWLERLPAAQRVELQQRQARWQALTPVERAVYGQRQLHWLALPIEERRAQRERWQAWRDMPEREREQLRRAAREFAALPADQRRQLRARFDALDGGARRGWLLGPVLGADYPRLQPLLAFVVADERTRLLDVLRAMAAAERDDLAVLAQRTPPEDREMLRRDLLATASVQRSEWLRQRLDR